MASVEQPEMPPVVYVPARPAGADQLEVEMQRLVDGRVAVFTYSAIDRLQDMYPGVTGWLALTVEGLQSLHDSTPYEVLFVDRSPNVVGGEPNGAGVAGA